MKSQISEINLCGDIIKSTLKHIFFWFITLCRVAVGSLVMKAGFDFTRGSGAFAYRETDAATGVFVIVIGAYFVFSSLFVKNRK